MGLRRMDGQNTNTVATDGRNVHAFNGTGQDAGTQVLEVTDKHSRGTQVSIEGNKVTLSGEVRGQIINSDVARQVADAVKNLVNRPSDVQLADQAENVVSSVAQSIQNSGPSGPSF